MSRGTVREAANMHTASSRFKIGTSKRARGMKTDKIQSADLARSGGAPDEE
jgi:hypothetical protein